MARQDVDVAGSDTSHVAHVCRDRRADDVEIARRRREIDIAIGGGELRSNIVGRTLADRLAVAAIDGDKPATGANADAGLLGLLVALVLLLGTHDGNGRAGEAEIIAAVISEPETTASPPALTLILPDAAMDEQTVFSSYV